MSAERGKTQQSGQWVCLMDYATSKNLSLSTLRRYIKANKVTFKLESGRYYLWDESAAIVEWEKPRAPEPEGLHGILKSTQTDLQKAKEEIAELKTLIAFYEERLPKGLEA